MRHTLPLLAAAALLATAPGTPLTLVQLQAQGARASAPAGARTGTGSGGSKGSASKPAEAITGSYAGTATVQLGDSTIVVPVSYQFTGTAPAITGTAMVPGQGTGAISHVVRQGTTLRFRVTAGEGKLLEHNGTIAANGAIEGFVNLDGQPVAKFRIAPGALPGKPAVAPPASGKSKGRVTP
jgi:hypothetical protein